MKMSSKITVAIITSISVIVAAIISASSNSEKLPAPQQLKDTVTVQSFSIEQRDNTGPSQAGYNNVIQTDSQNSRK